MKNVFSRRQMGIPYGVFLAFFVAAPLIVLFYYAFTNGSGQFTLNNLKNFFVDPNTMGTLCYSIVLAVTVTLICLVIAYPVAYILAGSALKRKGVILMLFVLPMWINVYTAYYGIKRNPFFNRRKFGISPVFKYGYRNDV